MASNKKADQRVAPKKAQIQDTGGDTPSLSLPARLQQGPMGTLMARSRLNIIMPATRVKELCDRDHDVRRQLIILADGQGRLHHGAALYYMSTSTTPTQAEA